MSPLLCRDCPINAVANLSFTKNCLLTSSPSDSPNLNSNPNPDAAVDTSFSPSYSMASCGGGDDDFGLLGDDDSQSHNHHAQQHYQQQQQQAAAPVPFVTHRYVTTTTNSSKGAPSLSLHNQRQHQHLHNHLHHHQPHQQQHQHPPPLKKSLVANEDDDGEDPNDDYGAAFTHAEPPKLPEPASFQDVACFADDNNNNDGNSTAGATAVAPNATDNTVKRKDRDDLSDDGVSSYCFVAGVDVSASASATKRSRPSSSTAAVPSPATVPSSSGDYRKDREEWSDSAIGCLLDAYTDKYIQLNRGNLRGRDWEEVATIVSERCDKHKSCKSVEQCKNKVDNLKKRYKAERQRITSGTLSSSHWPWFKKMDQIVGSSSALSKPVSDDDKSTTASTALVVAGTGPVSRQPKRYVGSMPGPVSLAQNIKLKSSNPRWERVVLKISGAAFAGTGPQNVEPKVTTMIAREISMAVRLGIQVAVVVGGRNFFCGDTWVAATGIDRATAYQIGMMATLMNSILLQASLEKIGVQTRVQTAFALQEIAEPYIKRRAIRHLEKGRVVIFGGVGAVTGNPLFTTDTAAALRASEINAEVVLKGISLDNVYDCHSRSHNTSFEHISYRESLSRGFSAMDMTAITFCEENNIPVVVFNLSEPGNISRALCGDQVGTLIDQAAGIS